jgi:hypothetical protein
VSTWRAVRIYRTAFVEDHDVIQTIAANALEVRVLSRRAGAVMTSVITKDLDRYLK